MMQMLERYEQRCFDVCFLMGLVDDTRNLHNFRDTAQKLRLNPIDTRSIFTTIYSSI